MGANAFENTFLQYVRSMADRYPGSWFVFWNDELKRPCCCPPFKELAEDGRVILGHLRDNPETLFKRFGRRAFAPGPDKEEGAKKNEHKKRTARDSYGRFSKGLNRLCGGTHERNPFLANRFLRNALRRRRKFPSPLF